MKPVIAILLLIICFTSTSYSQKATTVASLKMKLQGSDSMVAHEQTKAIIRIDSAGNKMPSCNALERSSRGSKLLVYMGIDRQNAETNIK